MLATLTTSEARHYLLAFVIVVGVILGTAIVSTLAAIAAYRATTRASKRYPVPDRERPEPEQPCDLGAQYRQHRTLQKQRERNELRRAC